MCGKQRRLSFASPVTVAVLGGLVLVLVLVLVLIAAVAPLSVLARQPVLTQLLQSYPDVVPLAAVGLIVAWRRPANPIGWLILVTAVLFLVKIDAPLYNLSVYRLGYHLPLGPVSLILDQSWLPALALLPLVILLFPDGRPPGRWRWVWAAYVALVVAYTSLLTANAAEAIARGHIQVDSSGQLTIFDHSSAYGGIAVALAAVSVFLGFCLAAVGYQVACWRRSTGDRRQQMKWFASGAAVTFVCVSISASLPFGSALSDVLIVGSSATAVGMGVGILRYRLYEIDRIISRTLAYAIVTGLLVALYAGLVLLATHVFTFNGPVSVAASTLAAAALFTPLRRRVQRIVDRRFNRTRYDAEQTVAAFAARLKDAVDLSSVRDDLATVVQRTLEPAHLSIWTTEAARNPSQTRPVSPAP